MLSSNHSFEVEAMKKAFTMLFAIALMSGIASTVAANVQLGTNLHVVTSN